MFAVVAAAAAAAAPLRNLVVNGDCESGGSALPLAPALGWSGGFFCCALPALCGAPLNGTHVFFAGDCSGPACATRANLYVQEGWQDVDVSAAAGALDGGTASLVLGSAERSECGFDAARATFELRDGPGGAVLSTSGTCSYRGGVWAPYLAVVRAPVGTRSVRVRLATTAAFGAAARGVHDAVSVSVCTTGAKGGARGGGGCS